MNKILDFIINILRWPVAIYLLLSIPALIQSYDYFDFYTLKFYALGSGILFFGFSQVASGSDMRRSMQIIAHELTHTVFALLTLHKVAKIRLHPDGSGGSMQLRGRGNWLITLTPYFFPLFAFVYMSVMPFLLEAGGDHWLIYAILGYFLAYYWATVISQVHIKQPDIISEGYVFSGIIIVAANLGVTGSILAFTGKLWVGVGVYLKLINQLNFAYWTEAYKLVLAYFQ